MDILNTTSGFDEDVERPKNGRRNFLWKVGGAMTAVLATAVPAMSKTALRSDTKLESEVARLSGQLGMLEDEKNIRSLHKTFEALLDKGIYENVPGLFTDNAEVIFNGGVFKGRNDGLHRLFHNHFSAGRAGKKMEPAPGFELAAEQQQDRVEISLDRRSAKAGFTYSMQVGAPIVSDSPLVQMARLQGEGIRKWWEGGVYEVSYVKDAGKGTWKIERLEFKTLSRADYQPGRSHAKPIAVNPFSKVYPHDPDGPDRVITKA